MAEFRKIGYLLALALGVSGCGQIDYESTRPGKFEGSLFVMWVGEEESSGDGKFVFVPDKKNPFRFIRDNGDGTKRTIIPQMMYTDGGSVPKFGQIFKGFAPWGYGPAYMIHDWLYQARHCIRDEVANEAELKVKDIDFDESAIIIAEAIKTLEGTGRVEKHDIAPEFITGAVSGPIAKSKWNQDGACPTPNRVSDEDRDAAEAAIPGSSGIQKRAVRGVSPDDAVTATVTGSFEF